MRAQLGNENFSCKKQQNLLLSLHGNQSWERRLKEWKEENQRFTKRQWKVKTQIKWRITLVSLSFLISRRSQLASELSAAFLARLREKNRQDVRTRGRWWQGGRKQANRSSSWTNYELYSQIIQGLLAFYEVWALICHLLVIWRLLLIWPVYLFEGCLIGTTRIEQEEVLFSENEVILQVCNPSLSFPNEIYFLQSRQDKWYKMASQEENVLVMNHFLDKAEFRVLIIFQSSAGLLTPANNFPDFIKHKMVYFVKRLVSVDTSCLVFMKC